jgi:hypothetical protein
MTDKAIFKKIEFEKLVLDSENPRLPISFKGRSEKDIINFFLSDASLIELMLAIATNGFFEGEQLLVVKEGEKFLVVEGNRRLSAVKLLQKPDLAEIQKNKVSKVVSEANFKPTSVPCLVFPKKENILKYLGFRHITGIKSWKLLEKARYLNRLKNDFFPNKSLQSASREIAKMIGSRRDYVVRVLAGFEIYEIIENNGFYRIKDLDDRSFHFNYIADTLNHSNLQNFLGVDFNELDPCENLNFDNIKQWTKWLFDRSLPNKIIGDSANLSLLNKVVAFPDALKMFQKGEKLSRAIELTDDINEQFQNSIKQAIDYLERADSISHKVKGFYSNLIDDLKDIQAIIIKIKTVKDRFELENLDEEL